MDRESASTLLPPIFSLPPETLCIIFELYKAIMQEPRPDSFVHLHNHRDRATWTRITHVCHRWRETALNYPGLWTDINSALSQYWLSEYITRAKGAPVSLDMYIEELGARKARDLASSLSSLMPNAATLKLNLRTHWRDGRAVKQAVRNLWKALKTSTQAAPHLSTLEFTASTSLHSGPHMAVLPEGFLRGGTPQLRSLYLRGCMITWTSGFLRGLTSLNLDGEGQDTFPRPTTAQFIVALSNMPKLAHLELHHNLPLMDQVPGDHLTQTAYIPHLQKLVLGGSCSECDHVMKHLRVSPSGVRDVEVQCKAVGQPEYSSLIQTLSNISAILLSGNLPPSFPAYPPQSLYVNDCRYSDLRGFFFVASSKEITLDFLNHPIRHEGTTSINRLTFCGFYKADGVATDTYSEFISRSSLEVLPLSHLRSVSLTGKPGHQLRRWMAALANCPNLTRVCVADDHVVWAFIEYLSGDPAISQLEGNEQQQLRNVPYLYRLETISVHDSNIFQAQQATKLSGLIDLLRRRRDMMGSSLKEIHIQHCSLLDEKQLQLLEGSGVVDSIRVQRT